MILPLSFTTLDELTELARAADVHGWAGVALSDHVVTPERIDSPYPYTKDGTPRFEADAIWPDPLVAFGAMAAVTERVRLVTMIYVLPMRNPFVVAKAVGTLAGLSGGRVDLGIGVGWMREEFELLGQEFRDRGRRTDEMIDVMRKLWTGEPVEHHGRFYDFAPLRMVPPPPSPVPILVGGLSKPALRRAARLGDGWISELHTTDELRGLIAGLREERAACDRGDEPFQVIAACSDAFDVDGFRRVEEAGATHALMLPWLLYRGDGSLGARCDAVRRFADEVIAKL